MALRIETEDTDALARALAATRGVPLRRVGNDVAQTDLDVWSP